MLKTYKSENYNFIFNKKTGFFARWGKTQEDDPEYSPFGPEILDIEISTICHKGCTFCYKSNGTYQGTNMSFNTFKKMFDKFPKHLTQVAFGIGDIDANKDLWTIMDYCRENGVIPNITINGDRMTPELYDKLANVCGAVAVSLYDKDTCYNAIKELTDRGMTQVNIHALLSEETLDNCYCVLEDRKTDKRLEKLNAVVLLWLKPKGNRNSYHQLSNINKLKKLVDFAIDTKAPFGFDSCTASNFLEVVKDRPEFEQYKIMSEPCESTLFSYYINVDGIGFPCSFTEGQSSYSGIDVLNCNNFKEDIWYHPETVMFRNKVLNSKDCNDCRRCVEYDLECR